MGLGFKDFAPNAVLTADDVDGYLMAQAAMHFTSTAQRDSELAGNLEEGMLAYNRDLNELWFYDGSVWVAVFTQWTDYTPAWTNLTLNSGTVDSARYRYQDGDLRVKGQITLAADSAITSTVFQTIPNSETADAGWGGGVGLASESGGQIYPCVVGVNPSAVTFSWVAPTGSVNATVPFTWGTGDILTWDFTIGVA